VLHKGAEAFQMAEMARRQSHPSKIYIAPESEPISLLIHPKGGVMPPSPGHPAITPSSPHAREVSPVSSPHGPSSPLGRSGQVRPEAGDFHNMAVMASGEPPRSPARDSHGPHSSPANRRAADYYPPAEDDGYGARRRPSGQHRRRSSAAMQDRGRRDNSLSPVPSPVAREQQRWEAMEDYSLSRNPERWSRSPEGDPAAWDSEAVRRRRESSGPPRPRAERYPTGSLASHGPGVPEHVAPPRFLPPMEGGEERRRDSSKDRGSREPDPFERMHRRSFGERPAERRGSREGTYDDSRDRHERRERPVSRQERSARGSVDEPDTYDYDRRQRTSHSSGRPSERRDSRRTDQEDSRVYDQEPSRGGSRASFYDRPLERRTSRSPAHDDSRDRGEPARRTASRSPAGDRYDHEQEPTGRHHSSVDDRPRERRGSRSPAYDYPDDRRDRAERPASRSPAREDPEHDRRRSSNVRLDPIQRSSEAMATPQPRASLVPLRQGLPTSQPLPERKPSAVPRTAAEIHAKIQQMKHEIKNLRSWGDSDSEASGSDESK
jgi:hypothetical protein